MATAARQRTTAVTSRMPIGSTGLGHTPGLVTGQTAVRVYLAAGTLAEQEAIIQLLRKRSLVQIVGTVAGAPLDVAALAGTAADVLLLTSCGDFLEDFSVIRAVRAGQPAVEIIMLGKPAEEAHFLQCVRAGVHGYLPQEASADEILQAISEVRGGAAVCPGKLCAQLFHYFEAEAKSLPSSSIHQRMGLTRREQQLIPLVAKGLTNKEIANHFSLSEQTIKNHLYRMKHKIGAEDRLSIVHLCRVQGFMV
jgi:DNA-binding NarL/FixJ family response regulator